MDGRDNRIPRSCMVAPKNARDDGSSWFVAGRWPLWPVDGQTQESMHVSPFRLKALLISQGGPCRPAGFLGMIIPRRRGMLSASAACSSARNPVTSCSSMRQSTRTQTKAGQGLCTWVVRPVGLQNPDGVQSVKASRTPSSRTSAKMLWYCGRKKPTSIVTEEVGGSIWGMKDVMMLWCLVGEGATNSPAATPAQRCLFGAAAGNERLPTPFQSREKQPHQSDHMALRRNSPHTSLRL